MNERDDIPYRGGGVLTAATQSTTTQDQVDYSTLRSVYVDLKKAMDDIDNWHAFDLGRPDGLSLAQQIVAHRKAYEMIAPAFYSVESALKTVDQDFIDKQRSK